MNDCAKRREELLDHALGIPASGELARHLADCPACAAALARLRAVAQQIEAETHRLVRSEPPEGFAARVLERKASARNPLLWLLRPKPALAALALLALTFAGGLLIRSAVRSRRQARAAEIASAISRWRSPTESLLKSPADPLLKTIPRVGETVFRTDFAKPTRLKKEGGEHE